MEKNYSFPLVKERKYVFEGVFDLKKAYNHTFDFLKYSRNYTFFIPDYVENTSETDQTIDAKIEATQEFSEYYLKKIIYAITLTGKKVEVEIDGEKKQLIRGTAKIHIKGIVTINQKKETTENKVNKFLGILYRSYIARDDVEKVIVSMYDDIGGLMQAFKDNLYPEH